MAYLKKIVIKLNNFEIERFVKIHKAKKKEAYTSILIYFKCVYHRGTSYKLWNDFVDPEVKRNN